MKKKLRYGLLPAALALTLTACSGAGEAETTAAPTEAQETAGSEASEASEEEAAASESQETEAEAGGAGSEAGSNILIAYFSMPEDIELEGIDANSGASVVVRDGEALGNVQYIAQIIQENTGADVFRIETVQQYPLDHDPLVDQAAAEQDEEARPELASHLENADQYDIIFLGYPNWWGDMPMPLYTFLEETDLSGKTIIPFCPHGGSGFSRTEETIAELQPEAQVSEDGFAISRNDVADCEEEVVNWVNGLGL